MTSVDAAVRSPPEVAMMREQRNQRYLNGVPRIADEDRLKYIVRSIPLTEFRLKAVENPNLKDEAFLEDTVLTDSSNAVALKALERLKNAGSRKRLEEILRRSDDEQIQLKAIDGVESPAALKEAGLHSPYASVRRKAILSAKLTDNDVFGTAIFCDKALPVCRAGVKRTSDPRTLSEILFQATCGRGREIWGDGYRDVVVDALLNPSLDDQHAVEEVIFGDFPDYIKLKAFERVSAIKNQRVLGVMLRYDTDPELRAHAAMFSGNVAELGRAMREDTSPEVKAAASKRIEQLREQPKRGIGHVQG